MGREFWIEQLRTGQSSKDNYFWNHNKWNWFKINWNRKVNSFEKYLNEKEEKWASIRAWIN